MNPYTIRQELPEDYLKVNKLVKEAFENIEQTDGDEHHLVERLRKSKEFVPELSLITEHEGCIVAHILFTEITIGNQTALALAPVSVKPNYQSRGIGSLLIQEGHDIARTLGYCGIIVLGHETYYPKFGYLKASLFNIKAPFDVTDNLFMALELIKDGLKGISGTVVYSSAFFEKNGDD